MLRSDCAIHVNVEIMRAFVRLRQMLASNADLARKLATLEKKYDAQFKIVFDAIRELMTPPEPKKKRHRIRAVGRKVSGYAATTLDTTIAAGQLASPPRCVLTLEAFARP